jgi:hypothetical protein
MKHFFIAILLFTTVKANAQVGIGNGTVIPHPTAALEIKDTARGLLIPRMSMAQRTAITNPAEALMVYQTDSTKGFWYYNGAEWKNVATVTNNINLTAGKNTSLIYTITGF